MALLLSLPCTLSWVPAALPEDKFHTYVLPVNHAFLFFLGGLVARARAGVPWRLTRAGFLAGAAALALVFSRYLASFYDHFVVMEGPPRYAFAALCLGMVALFAFRDFPRSPLKRAGLFLGEISYSVYLMHPMAREALRRLLPETAPQALGFGLGLALTVLLAAWTHRWVERPAMNWGRKLTARP